ncbi:hypothetical protein H6F67_00215 [Microcoleus sp. FACHB-1515]|uniref:nucleotide-binding protein n=1 Tax=Cyanophyceae TaxID=3028117 RepID=UPI001687EF4E|nr:hypothetical protein [Microcoleus sp. FACHB-1515]MBD2088299.1 hypothetical protein [Microcoleus sp. FACHB-1515]
MSSTKSSAAKMKRLIMILGGKGGTGKTLFCRLLYYFLVRQGVDVLGFDADIENPEFRGYHKESNHPVNLLNFLERKKAAQLLTTLYEKKPAIAMIDMPGASGRATREQMQAFGIFQAAEQLGYRLTIVTVLNNNFNTINSFNTMLGFCDDQADYVAVKSQVWAQDGLTFNRWEQSETRQKFTQLQGIEIDLPILDANAFDVLHGGEQLEGEGETQKATPQRSFFQYQEIPYGDLLLTQSFLNESRLHLEQAAPYLGLTSPLPIVDAFADTAPASSKGQKKSTKAEAPANAS